ncbi:type II toxin-antitoxin system RelE/ParE family toxin [Nonomuraea spiralis]|uniref:Type II toxin-antitoxin system RelE/ParE family toxin n=1 Tax=Nonomuraea spiralis TaxID=46182 RepID=A0ABV5I9Y9_9ACTN|nr:MULTISPECIES: hypothetical protein [Nonomuraea]RSN05571.1 hypothetical protein DMB42_26800 [Nonomuraea sp. WAC 01424]GGT05759.1 hypothetical protein GCM10010176_057600 [Nonomuraea spiralis]
MKGYHEIQLASPAVRELRSLHACDPTAAAFVLDWLEYVSTDLESGALRTLDKEAGLLKAEMGDFDALCWIRPEEMSLVVLTVSRRRHPA